MNDPKRSVRCRPRLAVFAHVGSITVHLHLGRHEKHIADVFHRESNQPVERQLGDGAYA